VQVEE